MELLLHYVWRHKLFPLQPLQTEDGQPVEVIDSGRSNMHAGPDFTGAKVKIGGTLWVGNVEIHERASDWMRHGHDTDKAYDTVILHVVSCIDAHPVRSSGQPIPQLLLPYPEGIQEKYIQLMHADRYPPCFAVIPDLPKLMLHAWLTALGQERLLEKTAQATALLDRYKGDWERTFFITLSRSFGFGVNSDPFERWATSVPLEAVGKHRDNLFQVEAFFFGQAGLLGSAIDDTYAASLAGEYAYLSRKFSLPPAPDCRWLMLRLRPANFPHVRIAQLAALYSRSFSLLSSLIEAETLKQIRQLFTPVTSSYWDTHYTFGKASTLRKKTLSRKSVDLLIINAVIPTLYAYGANKGDDLLCSRAESLLEQIKPEDNCVTRLWQECGLVPQHAADSQALLQLKKNYCDARKCLRCRIGYEYFASAPYRCREDESPADDKNP